MALRFSEKDELSAMSGAFKDVLIARASVVGMDDVVIKGIGFPKLTPEQQKAAPNHEQDLQEMEAALVTAVANALTWSNDIEPDVTILPQAYQNIFAFIKGWRPVISTMKYTDKVEILQAQRERLLEESTKLEAFGHKVAVLQNKVATDAENFSEKHAAFADLEKLDAESITATVAAIAKIKAIIAAESKTIEVDLTDAKKMIEVAKGIMEAGEKVKTGTEADELAKVLAVTVGVILIGIAEGKIDEALKTIGERLANAAKEVGLEINLSALTLQLLALQTAHNAIAGLATDLEDIAKVFLRAAAWFRARATDVQQILNEGAQSREIDEVSLMAYANAWEDLSKAGLNWQHYEVDTPATFKVPLAPFDPAIAPG